MEISLTQPIDIQVSHIHIPLISIVIVSFRDTSYLSECLSSIEKNTKYPNYEVIVVYYGSKKTFSKNYERVKVVNIQKNIGYSEANNIGIKIAKGDLICLLNNDVIVSEGWLLSLYETLVSRGVACVQSKLFLSDHPERLDSVGHIIDPLGFLRAEGYMERDVGQYNTFKKICVVQPAACLVDRKVINEIGLFDGDFFWGHEDTDFSIRLHLRGYDAILDPKSIVYHKRSATLSKMPEEFIVYFSRRNILMTILKNYQLRNALIFGGLHTLLVLGISIWYLLKGKGRCSLAIYNALLWNFLNLRRIWKKRYRVQRLRTVKDKELFKKMDRINLVNLVRKRHYGSLVLGHLK